MNTLFQKLQATDLGLYRTHLILPLRRMVRSSLMVLLVATGLLLFIAQAQAVTTSILHSFGDGSVTNDGISPQTTLLLGTDGNYYGVATQGGSANKGTFYKITPSGTMTILHNFGDGTVTNDGRAPDSNMVMDSSGNFYGTTGAGGPVDGGTVFKITAAGSETILHIFVGGTGDGGSPLAGLVRGTDGNFYGTTFEGGSAGDGVIFKVTPTRTFTLLHSFTGTTSDGNFPDAALIQATDGQFYGTTTEGGSANKGIVFKITSTGTFTLLHSFGTFTNDGINPQAALFQSVDGNFYGTTANGGSGSNAGIAFKMTSAGAVTILHRFGDGTLSNDGLAPEASLIQIGGGDLYGTTIYGGSGESSGTVFEMTTTGTVTILHNFDDGSVTNDGLFPLSNLILGADGSLYSSTLSGGSANKGTLFKVSTYTILHEFGDGSVTNDGQASYGNLIKGSDGNFYGTTEGGGSANDGVAYKITPSGTVTILHSFHDGSVTNDGNEPNSLILGADGNFYATTYKGGSANYGTFFKMTPSGSVTILHNFHDGSVASDGAYPDTGLLQSTDGNFYGATYTGGSTGAYGTAFKITPTGTETILHNFGDGSVSNDGIYGCEGLILGTDGNFYGMSGYGGSTAHGTLFKMTLSGTETILHQFGDGSVSNDGLFPNAPLILGTDRNLYGTTENGGSTNSGTFFKITSTGTETILHHFSDGSVPNDGIRPKAGLILGPDGNFYGQTYQGGVFSTWGCLYQVTPTGSVTIIHSFDSVPNDGSQPYAQMAFGSNGYLYGTTSKSGSANAGIVFKLLPP